MQEKQDIQNKESSTNYINAALCLQGPAKKSHCLIKGGLPAADRGQKVVNLD
jgi:hypothetical protein